MHDDNNMGLLQIFHEAELNFDEDDTPRAEDSGVWE